jgi:hypothetical protein
MIRAVGILIFLTLAAVVLLGLLLQAIGVLALWFTAAVTASAIMFDFASLIWYRFKRT